MPIYHCTKRLTVPSLLILASMIIACSEPPPPLSETVRAIRTVTVSEPASGKMRRFSGVVEAATTSSISFEVPGNVQEVKVDVGDSVSKGQVLARLDESRFQLNLDAANATVEGPRPNSPTHTENGIASGWSSNKARDSSANRHWTRPKPTMRRHGRIWATTARG